MFRIKQNRAIIFGLFGILFLSLLLRTINLSSLPNGLHVDELNAGYQGYKIIKTGSDIFGNLLPLYVNRIGDYRPAGIFYLAGLSEMIFGLQTYAIRLPVAIIGSLTVFPLFFLVFLISKNRIIALLSTLLLAISPWHIVASRATSESLIALFLTMSGISLLLFAMQKRKTKYILLAFFSLIASYFFYHIPRLFIPVFLLLLTVYSFLITRKPANSKKDEIQGSVLLKVFIAILLITIIITFTKFGTGRFNQTSIFASKDLHTHIQVLQDIDQGNILTARIFHNKPVVFAKTFIDQYLSYFSTEYLYIKGGLPERYVVGEMGLFYYIELPLLLIGLYFIIKKRNVYTVIPLLWLVCGPLAASITLEDSPNVQRSIFMLPAFQIIEAYGIYYSLLLVKPSLRFVTAGTVSLIFLLNMVYFFHVYVTHSPAHISFLRNDGIEGLFTSLQQKADTFDTIYLPLHEDMPMYYAHFRHDPSVLLSTTRDAYREGVVLGKYHFVPSGCPGTFLKEKEFIGKRVLIASEITCQLEESRFQELEKIMRRDGTGAYVVSSIRR